MLSWQRIRRRKPRIAFLTVPLALFVLAWLCYSSLLDFFASSDRSKPRLQRQVGSPRPPKAGECPPEIENLRDPYLGLTETIVYSRRCVRPRWSSGVDRQQVTKLNGPLITHRSTVNLTSCRGHSMLVSPCEPIALGIPHPYPRRTYRHLLFGVSTTYERLRGALPAFSHWLSGSQSRLVAVVYDGNPAGAKSNDLAKLQALYREHSISLTALRPRDKNLTIAQNHFSIIGDLVQAANLQTEWLVLVDDDTFFPSLHRLDEELRKHDPTQQTWLGALSEDFDAVRDWGYMAYGGAGVFLSLPLAQRLVPRIPTCLREATLPTGDVILRDCIHDHTATKLTIVPGLYQHDLYGDVSGFYESGVRPLSVHHYRSWYREPLPKMAAVGHLCGDCFLQRFQFGDDTLLANGYSITQYRRGLRHYDLTQMEGTWSQPGRSFDYSLGPLRAKLGEDEKKSYRLKDVLTGNDGSLRQIYVYKGDFNTDQPDEIVELVWEGKRGLMRLMG